MPVEVVEDRCGLWQKRSLEQEKSTVMVGMVMEMAEEEVEDESQSTTSMAVSIVTGRGVMEVLVRLKMEDRVWCISMGNHLQ